MIALYGALVALLVTPLLGAGEAAGGQLTVSWVDNSSGTAQTVLERRPGTSSVFTIVATLPPGVTEYVDTSVTAGDVYCYRASAAIDNRGSAYSNDACAFAANPVPTPSVTVGKVGTGAGTVTSVPAGINCGATCSATYLPGTSVTLTATAASGSTFSGWSGGGCAGSTPCTLAGNASVTVTATFSSASPTLSVAPATGPPGTVFTITLANWSGGASGWVTIAPAGATNSVYGAWAYVSTLPSASGTRTWRVTLNTPGTFEARLFLNDGYTRAATSAPLSVANTASLTVSATSPALTVAPTGGSSGTEFVVSVTNWSGGYYGWLTIAPAGVGNAAYGPWVYVGSLAGDGGSMTWRVTLRALGVFEARLFLNNGFTPAASSAVFTVPSLGGGVAPVAP